MEHLTLKATTTEVDQELGTFVAVASSWSADRQGDEIARDAFDQSLADWRASGKRIPLLFEHESEVVGHLDPDEMYTDERGLIVAGEVDRTSEHGQMVWRSVKDHSAGFSIGFLAEGRPLGRGESKGRLLTVIDLLEVSWTAKPVHQSTKVLGWKSASETDWKDVPRYDVPKRGALSYRELGLHMEIKAAVEKAEAQEQAAAQQAAQAAATPAIPVTDQQFTDDQGRHLADCAAADCSAVATNPNGSLRFVADRRWWCPRHEHLAQPGDDEPAEPTYTLNENFALVLNPESERGKQVAAEAERQQKEQRERKEAEEQEAKALREVRDRYEREAVVNVCGFQVNPADVHVR